MVHRQRAHASQQVSRREGRGQTAKKGATKGGLDFSTADVVAAVRSLYSDELKPFGRVILKRLREHAAAQEAVSCGYHAHEIDPEDMPKIDPKRLRRICESCLAFEVFPEEGREYSVIFRDRGSQFVDVRSEVDRYSVDFWAQAADYFESLSGDMIWLPGGRYACARVLVSRRLAFLKKCSLGEVCHIVQLAISRHKLLGYLDGHLVPFHASDERVKEQCAMAHQPFSQRKGSSDTALPLASWEDARSGLSQLLNTGRKPGSVTLSNVKRLFRSRLKMELSETALGHARLHDLLVDERFSDVCIVHGQGNGQVLVRSAAPRTEAIVDKEVAIAAPLPLEAGAMLPKFLQSQQQNQQQSQQQSQQQQQQSAFTPQMPSVPLSFLPAPDQGIMQPQPSIRLLPEQEDGSSSVDAWPMAPAYSMCSVGMSMSMPTPWVDQMGCEMMGLTWDLYGLHHDSDQSTVGSHGRHGSGDETDLFSTYEPYPLYAQEIPGAMYVPHTALSGVHWMDTEPERPESPWTPPDLVASEVEVEADIVAENSVSPQPSSRLSSLLALVSPTILSKRSSHVKNTFIHIDEELLATSRRRAYSAPPGFGAGGPGDESEEEFLLPPRMLQRQAAVSF